MAPPNTVTCKIRASGDAGRTSTATCCEPTPAEGEPAGKRQRLSNQPKSGAAPDPFPGLAQHLVSADAYKDAIFMQLDQQHFHGTNPGLIAHLKLGAQSTFSRLPVSSNNPQERVLTLSNGQMVTRTQEEVELNLYLEAHFSEMRKKPPEVVPSSTARNAGAVKPPSEPRPQKIAVPETPQQTASLKQNTLRTEFKPEQTSGAYTAVKQAFIAFTSATFIEQGVIDGADNLPSIRPSKEDDPASKTIAEPLTEDQYAAIAASAQTELKNSTQWEMWKHAHNITTVPNNSDGTRNCLLLSILQHASGRYHESAMHEHQEVAKSLRAEMLNRKLGGIKADNHLSLEDEGVKWAIQKINEMYARDLHVMTFHLSWKNGKNSDVAPLISDEVPGKEPVAIYGDSGHFEAVILKQ